MKQMEWKIAQKQTRPNKNIKPPKKILLSPLIWAACWNNVPMNVLDAKSVNIMYDQLSNKCQTTRVS